MANILDKNDRLAAEINKQLAESGIFTLNLLGSPGSGKTSLLEKTIAALKDELRLAVIEGDLFTAKDAERIARQGVPVVQINTGGGCHLDANMVKGVLGSLDLERLDLLIIENVGNLVCPAAFDLGETKVTVLSIPRVKTSPSSIRSSSSSRRVVLNKIDLLPYTSFDWRATEQLSASTRRSLIKASCRTGEGLENGTTAARRSRAKTLRDKGVRMLA
jgi:hydrogenase nickel incorporation protein HypB